MKFLHIQNTYTIFTFLSQFRKPFLLLQRICWQFPLSSQKETKWQISKITSATISTTQGQTSPTSSESSAMTQVNGRMLFKPTKEELFPCLLIKGGQPSLPHLPTGMLIQLPATLQDLLIRTEKEQQTA